MQTVTVIKEGDTLLPFKDNFSTFQWFSDACFHPQSNFARWSGWNNTTALGSLLTMEYSIKLLCTEINACTHTCTHSNTFSHTPRCSVKSACARVYESNVRKLYLTAGIFLSGRKSHRQTRCMCSNLAPLPTASRTLEDNNDGERDEIWLHET